MGFSEDEYSKVKCVTIVAPFYSDKKNFQVGLSTRGIDLGFTPVETIPKHISKFFQNNHLVQMTLNNCILPEREFIYEQGIKPFQKGIIHQNGLLHYTPKILQNESIFLTTTEGVDVYIICSDIDEKELSLLSKAIDIEYSEHMEKIIEVVNKYNFINGIIINNYEGWIIYHEDEQTLLKLSESILTLGKNKFLSLNELDSKEDYQLPQLDKLIFDKKLFSNIAIHCYYYLEESDFVFYWTQDKKYDSICYNIPELKKHCSNKSFISKLKKYCIPVIVKDRAYKRKILFRFSLQYLLVVLYLMVFSFGIVGITEFLIGEKISYLALGASFIGFILSVMALFLSFYYFVKALFSKRPMIRTNI